MRFQPIYALAVVFMGSLFASEDHLSDVTQPSSSQYQAPDFQDVDAKLKEIQETSSTPLKDQLTYLANTSNAMLAACYGLNQPGFPDAVFGYVMLKLMEVRDKGDGKNCTD